MNNTKDVIKHSKNEFTLLDTESCHSGLPRIYFSDSGCVHPSNKTFRLPE